MYHRLDDLPRDDHGVRRSQPRRQNGHDPRQFISVKTVGFWSRLQGDPRGVQGPHLRHQQPQRANQVVRKMLVGGVVGRADG